MPSALSDLRTRVYARVDEGAQNYVGVPEMNALINEGAEHLHNWIVSEGEAYAWKESTIPLLTNQSDYTLPTDFMKLLKLFGPATNSTTIGPPALKPMNRIMPGEYRGMNMGWYQGPSPQYPQAYMLLGNVLRIMPVPSVNSGSVVLWYAPNFAPLVADTDMTELAMFPGAEEFIVNQAAIGFRLKEESDTSGLERRQAQIQQMIQQSIQNRDMGQHQTVVDVDRGDNWNVW